MRTEVKNRKADIKSDQESNKAIIKARKPRKNVKGQAENENRTCRRYTLHKSAFKALQAITPRLNCKFLTANTTSKQFSSNQGYNLRLKYSWLPPRSLQRANQILCHCISRAGNKNGFLFLWLRMAKVDYSQKETKIVASIDTRPIYSKEKNTIT